MSVFHPTSDTTWDLQFSLFGIPVRVHWSFWLGAVLFGWGLQDARLIFLFVVAMFLAILVHELGHSITILLFGARSGILMYMFGGMAGNDLPSSTHPWKRIVISLMGPVAGFLFAAASYWTIVRLFDAGIQPNQEVLFLLWTLFGINLWFSIFNLLPIYPLDGGQILFQLLVMFRVRRTVKISAIVSIVTAALTVAFLMRMDQPGVFLMALLVFDNIQRLREPDYY
jgi:stage IV sporulation protein FB